VKSYLCSTTVFTHFVEVTSKKKHVFTFNRLSRLDSKSRKLSDLAKADFEVQLNNSFHNNFILKRQISNDQIKLQSSYP
jgi:hypothetical protein